MNARHGYVFALRATFAKFPPFYMRQAYAAMQHTAILHHFASTLPTSLAFAIDTLSAGYPCALLPECDVPRKVPS
jgi:hypothetical protein